MAKFCINCGSQLNESANFCSSCGMKQNTSEKLNPEAILPDSSYSNFQSDIYDRNDIRTITQPTNVYFSVETHQKKEPKNMAVAKIVFGILSIAISMVELFQSCTVGFLGTFVQSSNGEGFIGIIVSIFTITVGITAISTRKHKGGNVALIVLCALGAFLGWNMKGQFGDLGIYAIWLVIVGGISIISLITWRE